MLIPPLMQDPFRPGESLESRIQAKHNQYTAAAKFYRFLYYSTRLIGGLCAAILPFVVSSNPSVATCFSIAIAVTVVIDMVFSPKERWKSYSRATDLLFVADLKRRGQMDEFQEQINIILSTEDQQLLDLLELDKVIRNQKSGSDARG